MLQQTQAERVVEKYNLFISEFPDFRSLATTDTENLLKLWHGLGYNRRALWMKDNAQIISERFDSKLPSDPLVLEQMKGIGHATAREMVIFSYNTAHAFIETNIRRVFIHLLFNSGENISDKQILPLVEKTMSNEQPRQWFYALIDYGVMLKKKFPQQNPNKKSSSYKPQSRFEGSNRQLRGKILQLVIQRSQIALNNIASDLGESLEKVRVNVDQMIKEGFFSEFEGKICFKSKN
jgi:A/G-specific adenine glycosylase